MNDLHGGAEFYGEWLDEQPPDDEAEEPTPEYTEGYCGFCGHEKDLHEDRLGPCDHGSCDCLFYEADAVKDSLDDR